MARISGPLLDRIDIHIEVPAVSYQELSGGVAGTSSADMRGEVLEARRLQQQRFAGAANLTNAQMSSRQLREHCVLDTPSRNALRDSVQEMGLSARAHDKILRVARTIADLDQSPDIALHHLQEAINYRMLDRTLMQ
jgi:magnesium chelatase family protein